MAMMNEKSIAYFIVGGVSAFSYLLKDAEITLKVDTQKETTQKDKKKRITLIALIIVMLGVLAAVLVLQPSQNSNNTQSANQEQEQDDDAYAALDKMIAILDKEDKDSIILFAGFNNGQYLEYYGYHPYIDGRAELFLKDNNKEFDYFQEYVDVDNAEIYYKDFVDKYGFTYLIVDDTDKILKTSLEHDDDYEIVCKSGKIEMFKLKG